MLSPKFSRLTLIQSRDIGALETCHISAPRPRSILISRHLQPIRHFLPEITQCQPWFTRVWMHRIVIQLNPHNVRRQIVFGYRPVKSHTQRALLFHYQVTTIFHAIHLSDQSEWRKFVRQCAALHAYIEIKIFFHAVTLKWIPCTRCIWMPYQMKVFFFFLSGSKICMRDEFLHE